MSLWKFRCGQPAIALSHVEAALEPGTLDIRPQLLTEPDGPHTFSLTVVEIPRSGVEIPAITTGHVFLVRPGEDALTYAFAAGEWLYTIQDTAVLRCFAYSDHGVYRRGEKGYLRIHQGFVVPCLGQHIPPVIASEPEELVESWIAMSEFDHHYVGILFPALSLPMCITSVWHMEPAGGSLDECAALWPKERVRRARKGEAGLRGNWRGGRGNSRWIVGRESQF